jgi:protease-4
MAPASSQPPASARSVPRTAPHALPIRLAMVLMAALLLAVPVGRAHAIWPFDTVARTPDRKADAPGALRVYRLAGPLPERSSAAGLLQSGDAHVFGELVTALRADIAADGTQTLLFKLRAFTPTLAQADELARLVAAARAAKKEVEVHADGLGIQTLHAFGGASRVVLAPEASVLVPGLRVEVSFYRRLLASVGLEADFEAVGDYKSAGEAFTRDAMSDAARENLDALLDDLWSHVTTTLAGHRRLKPEAAVAALDAGLLGAEAAVRARLVDGAATFADHLGGLEARLGPASVAWPPAGREPELGSLFDLMKLLGDDGGDEDADRPAIAVIRAVGTIVDGREEADILSDGPVVASETFLDDLHAATTNPRVKAIVLRVDSPGGSALASEQIWQALERASESRPVLVSLGSMAASGGYYIASAGDQIIAEPSTLTGSIGVFGGKLVYKDLLEKVGVGSETLGRGRMHGLLSGLGRFDDAERAAFRASLEHTYRTFVNRVSRGRNMGYDAVEAVARGRVWTGRQALERGLVDRLGGLDDAIVEARRRAGLTAEGSAILWFPRTGGLLDLLTGRRPSSRIAGPDLMSSPLLAALPPALAARFARAVATLRRLTASGGALALLPLDLEIR